MSTSDYAAMGQPYTAEEIEKMEGADARTAEIATSTR